MHDYNKEKGRLAPPRSLYVEGAFLKSVFIVRRFRKKIKPDKNRRGGVEEIIGGCWRRSLSWHFLRVFFRIAEKRADERSRDPPFNPV